MLAGLASASPVKERVEKKKKRHRAQSQHLIQAHVSVFRLTETGSFRIVASMATAALVFRGAQLTPFVLKHLGAKLLLLWELSVLTCQALKRN